MTWWQSKQGRLTRTQLQSLTGLEEQGWPGAISDISLWEAALLVERGRLELAASLEAWLEDIESHPGVAVLPVTARIAVESVRLGGDSLRTPPIGLLLRRPAVTACAW